MDSDIKRIFGREPEEIVIEIEKLWDFKNHPFKIQDDLQMRSLKESIQKYGILTPLIVRPVMEGHYEIISGHRRRYIAKMLGFFARYLMSQKYGTLPIVFPRNGGELFCFDWNVQSVREYIDNAVVIN